MRAALALLVALVPGLALAGTPAPPPLAPRPQEGLTPGAELPVDLHNGSFHHEIAIEVPHFHGLEPALALAHHSSGGNAFAGVGWALTGFSTIERVSGPAHGTRRCTADDIYTLDGEPLVACTALGGTHCTKQQSYRRIQFDSAADRWTIWDRNGTKLTYTKTFQVPFGLPNASCPYRYGLSTVEDALGNKVTYRWFDDSAGGDVHKEVYPASVSYNGVTVTLYREERPDPVSYANGFDWSNQHLRLRSVVVTVNSGGPAGGGAEQVLRAYGLGYGASPSGRSQLTAVTQYGRDVAVDGGGAISGGSKLWTQTFAYGGGGVGFTDVALSDRFSNALGWTDVANYSTMRLADIDGDGRLDVCGRADNGIYCYRQVGQGWEPFPNIQASPPLADSAAWGRPEYYSTIQFPDLNGDGKADLCARGAAGLACYYNDNNTFVSFNQINQFTDAGAWTGTPYYSSIRFADINGDGKADVCARASFGVLCVLQNAQGTGWGATISGPAWTDAAGWADPSHYQTIQYPDINGDGRADICGRGPDGVRCHLSTGDGFDNATVWLGPNWSDAAGWKEAKYYATIQFPDINGDGKADVCGRSAKGVECHLAIGSARVSGVAKFAFNTIAITDPPFSDVNGWGGASYYSTLQFADINGDGRDDLCFRTAAGVGCDLSNGTSFSRAITDSPVWSDALGWSDLDNYSTIRFVDINGDGKADIFGRQNAGLIAVFTRPDGPERMTAITNNGRGGSVRITTAPSSTFPSANNPPIEQVVTALEESDGRGHLSRSTFSYSGGSFDRIEKRSLGFRYVKRTLPAIDGEAVAPFEERWFMQAPYACVGSLDYDKRSTGANRLLTYTQNAYQAAGSGAGPFTCLLDQVSDIAYDSSGNTTCTAADNAHCKRKDVNYDYDAFGNITVTYDYGDYFDASDDLTKETFYVQNAAAYLVGTESVVRVHPGIGTTAPMINESRIFYDGATAIDTPPTAGLPTLKQEWVSNTGGTAPGPAYVSRKSGYDSFGNLLFEEDALGHRTTHTYDPLFQAYLASSTNPLGQVTSRSWDTLCGVPSASIDLNGQVTTFQYDVFCRVTRRDGPLGGFEIHAYSPLGDATAQWTRVEGPPVGGIAGNVYQITWFDGLERTYRTQGRGPDPAVDDDLLLETEFDARSNVRTTSQPRYQGQPAMVTTSDHDELDRLTKATYADGASATLRYELWTTVATDEAGRQVSRTLDARGHLVSLSEKDGATWNVVRHTYDGRGDLLRTVDPAGNVITYDHNSLGQKLSEVDPDLGTSTYTYDANGQLASQTDARNHRAELAYDAIGRLLIKTFGAETGAPQVVRYTYDQPRSGFFNVGQVTTMTDAAGTATFDYDEAGRSTHNTRTLAGTTHTFQRSFDAAGRLLGVRYPDGDVLGDDPATAAAEPPFRYDASGKLRVVPGLIDDVTYHPGGHAARVANANGTVTTRTYSPSRGWLEGIDTILGPQPILDLAYSRAPDGKINSIESAVAGQSWSYGYDPLGRLTRATRTGTAEEQTFSYDAIGNMLTNSRLGAYGYAPAGAARPHAVASAGSRSFQYDTAGNMTAGNGRQYVWDVANRLAKVTVGSNVGQFVYDGDGERVEKRWNGTVTRYLGEDYEIGAAVTKYFRLDGELVAKKVGQQRFWIHGNHLDSVAAVTDDQGNVVKRDNQRAYGESFETSGTHAEAHTFTGQRSDESGLVYFHARYYDPQLGRFLSPDAEIPGDVIVAFNRYVYAFNDPVNYTDPSGHHINWNKVARFATVAVVSMVAAAACGPAAPVCGTLAASGATFLMGMAWDGARAGITHDKFKWGKELRENGVDAAFSVVGDDIGGTVAKTVFRGAIREVRGASLSRSAAILKGAGNLDDKAWALSRSLATRDHHLERWASREEWTSRGLGLAGDADWGTFYERTHALDEDERHHVPDLPPPVRHSPAPFIGPRLQLPLFQPASPLPFRYGGSRPSPVVSHPYGIGLPHCCFMPSYFPPPPPPPPPPSRGGGGGGCFVAGSRVTMADGTQKPIEEIQIGEKVLAFDERTGAVGPAAVTHVFVHRRWSNESGTVLVNGRVRATSNHPFFVNGRWARAEELRPGDVLRVLGPLPGELGARRTMVDETVRSVAPQVGADTVYNLEISGSHTYFVEGLLVHNMFFKI
jgi:RHS repeat-associated protein